MSNQYLKLRRSSVPGKIPTTSSLEFGEIALNTYDGLAFIKKSGSNGEEIVIIGATSGSFTGSLFGTASWAINSVSASYFSGSISNAIFAETSSYSLNINGEQYRVAVFDGNNSITSSTIYQSASFTAIRATAPNDPTNPDILFVDGTGIESYNLVSALTDIDSYAQLNIQNISAGSTSSADIVATNNIGDEESYYINMGINGDGYNVVDGIGNQNDAYLYSTGEDLLIGNAAEGKRVIIFNGTGSAFSVARVFIVPEGTVGINSTDPNPTNPESLLVEPIAGATDPSSFSNLIIGKGTIHENYLQLNMKNLGTGSAASSDIVATNDIGTEIDYYIDMGVNSSGYSVPNAIGTASDAYLYSTANHLHIGNASAGMPIMFFAGGLDSQANRKLEIWPDDQHYMTGSLDMSGSLQVRIVDQNDALTSLVVVDTATGLLQYTNTASYASLAITASYAELAQSASYVLASQTSSFVTSSNVYGPFGSNSILTASHAETASSADAFTVRNFIEILPGIDPGTANISASYFFVTSSGDNTEQNLHYRNNGALWETHWLEQVTNTGLVWGGVLTFTASLTDTPPNRTQLRITPGAGLIINHNANTASHGDTIPTYVEFGPITASADFITSSQVTYLLIDENGQLQQQTTKFTPEQYIEKFPLGYIFCLTTSSISSYADSRVTTYGQVEQEGDFIRAFGPLKISGYDISAQSGSLKISIASGQAFRYGGFYSQNPQSPSIYDSTATPTGSLVRIYRDPSVIGGFRAATNFGLPFTNIDPTKWDDGSGTLQTVSSSQWSIQRVFQGVVNNVSYVYYGQNVYDSLALALQSITTDQFEESPTSILALPFIGYIIAKGDASNLGDTTNNRIVQAGLFRNTAGSSGGGGAAAQNLNDLNDVNITGPVNGQALVYSSGLWINSNPSTASFALTASYVPQVISASYSVTSSYSEVSQTASFVTASNVYGPFGSNSVISSSYAFNAISSSYPIAVTGSNLYSVDPKAAEGIDASNAFNSIYLGDSAGSGAPQISYVNFFGQQSGYSASSAGSSNFLGYRAGYVATNAGNSNFLGSFAGSGATYAEYSNFLGNGAGGSAASASYSNFLGYAAGDNAISARDSNFLGSGAGGEATYASSSNFLGSSAGYAAINAAYSNLFGDSVGYRDIFSPGNGIGRNNIIIGTRITLENDRKDSINLGAIIFATGSYFSTTGNPFSGSVGNGRVGINQPLPKYSLDVSGSGRYTNGLQVTASLNAPSITGSLLGTASWAQNATTASLAQTASYVLQAVSASFASTASFLTLAQSASYVLNAVSSSFASSAATASFVSLSQTASYVQLAQSASYVQSAQSASYVLNAVSSSFASTASYVGLAQTASFVTTAQTASYVQLAQSASYVQTAQTASFVTASNVYGPYGSNSVLTASYAVTAAFALNGGGGTTTITVADEGTSQGTATFLNFTGTGVTATVSSNTASINIPGAGGSAFPYTGSAEITGSLIVTGSVSSNGGFSGSLFGTASWAQNAITASYVKLSESASYVQNSQTASFVNTAQTASYVVLAQTASFVATSSWANNSITASYVKNSETASYVQLAQTSSFVTLAQTASFVATASWSNNSITASYVKTSETASYVQLAQTASYVVQAVSSSFATTASYVQLAQSASFVATSSWANNAVTASYVKFAESASYVLQAVSSSFATTASYSISSSYALTASYALQSVSASFATTASFVTLAQSASYIQNAQTSSYVLNAVSASFATTASYSVSASYSVTASYAVSASHAQTASYALQSVSSSYAQTSSYAINVFISGSITNADYVQFNTSSTVTDAVGRLYYNNGEGTLNVGLAGGNVVARLGEDLFQYSYNATGAPLTKGQVVYISGSQGNRIAIKLASATAEQGSAQTLGFVAESIAIGGEGWIQTEGVLRKLNTTGLTGGQLLYLSSSAGQYTPVKPAAPLHEVRLGFAERIDATVGSIYIRIENGYELDEIHNVLDTSTTASYGDLLVKSGSIWINSKQLTGSYGLTGSLNATAITSSLYGTSSWSQNSVSSSYAATASSANAFTVRNFIELLPGTDPGTANISASYLFATSSSDNTEFNLHYRNNGALWETHWLEQVTNTGLVWGGVLTFTASLTDTPPNRTEMRITPGAGLIINHNANTGSHGDTIPTYVQFGPITASADFITSSQVTYLLIDENGQLIQQTSKFTTQQYVEKFPLGYIFCLTTSSISSYADARVTTYGQVEQEGEFVRAFGPLKLSGYDITAQSSSLKISIASGQAFRYGGFYTQNPQSPSIYDSAATPTGSLVRIYRDPSVIGGFKALTNLGLPFTDIDPTKYDDGSGTLQTVSASQWSIQRVFQGVVNNVSYVYYGQNVYDSLALALQSIATDQFVESPTSILALPFIGYIIAKGDATNLADTTNNRIIQAGLFRNTAGSSGGGGAAAQNLNDLGDVNITGPINGEALVYNSGLWVNGNPNSSSFATNASTASYVQLAQTASYVLNAVTASFVATASWANNATTASYVKNSETASYVQLAQTASFVTLAQSASFVATASWANNSVTASFVRLAQTASYVQLAQTASYVLNAVTASFVATASWANNAITSSYVKLSESASYVLQAVSASFATNSSTASYVVLAQTASFVTLAQTASYVNLAQSASFVATASWAQNAITSSYVKNSETASYVLQAVSSSFATNASTASYVVLAQTASFVTLAQTASFVATASWANNAVTASFVRLAQTASFVSLAQTASFVTTAQTASFVTSSNVYGPYGSNSILSASFAVSASWAPAGSSGLVTKAGSIANTSFVGNPKKAAVLFSTPFANTSYAIAITGEDARTWTVEGKLTAGFTASANSNTNLAGTTYWIATAYGETT